LTLPPPPPIQPEPPPAYPSAGPYAGGFAPAGYAPVQPYGVRFGGFWIRFVAHVIDGLITGAVTYGLLFAVKPISCVSQDGNTCLPGTTTLGAGFFPIIAIPAVYLVVTWAVGGTLGQRILGLRVVRADTGTNLGVGRALLRGVGYILASAILDIGLIWAAFDSRKQGWHDKIAGSLVIHRR
jgi:uncharacterized RDD family membrane protein YckC